MKAQTFLVPAVYLFSLASSRPVYPGPQLHTFDTNRKSEDALFLERWQKNWGTRPSKPAPISPPSGLTRNPFDIDEPVFTGEALTSILKPLKAPPTPAIQPQVMPDKKKPKKVRLPSAVLNSVDHAPVRSESKARIPQVDLNSVDHIPEQPGPAVYSTMMHGALGFLKPKPKPDPIPAPASALTPVTRPDPVPAADWRDWVPLNENSPPVGLPVSDALDRESRGKPAGLDTLRSSSASVSGVSVLMDAPPRFVMPLNTVTKADVVNRIIAQMPTECPDCGIGLNGNSGWKARFAAWFRALWKKLTLPFRQEKKINRSADMPGIWWLEGEGFRK